MPAKGWKKAPDGTWAPPNQMRHTLEIEEDTQVFLHEEFEAFRIAFVAGKGVRSVGEIAKGALRNETLMKAILISLGIGFGAFYLQKGGKVAGDAAIDIWRQIIRGALPQDEEEIALKAFDDAWVSARENLDELPVIGALYSFILGAVPKRQQTPYSEEIDDKKARCVQLNIEVALQGENLRQEGNPAIREQIQERIDKIREEQSELGC